MVEAGSSFTLTTPESYLATPDSSTVGGQCLH